MPVAWPASVPFRLRRDSFADDALPAVAHHRTANGAAKARRIATAPGRDLSGEMVLTPAQAATLRSFHRANEAQEITVPDLASPPASLTVLFAPGGCRLRQGAGGLWFATLAFWVIA